MEKDLINIFRHHIQKDWYPMSADAVPLFLSTAASSGFTMEKIVGYRYHVFLIRYQKDYGTMHYLNSDLERLWQIIKKQIEKDPQYLLKIKKKHQEIFQKEETNLGKKLETGLSHYDDQNLLALFREAFNLQIDSVGIAHIIEPIGIILEREFKKLLAKFILNSKEMNRAYVILAAPTKPSFIAQEEGKLAHISTLPSGKRKTALARHLKKYFWIHNSYAGPREVDIKILAKRLKKLRVSPKCSRPISKSKQNIIQQYHLNKEIQKMMQIIDFTTVWQDERKANILKSISYFSKVVAEISRRINIDPQILYYFSVGDVPKMHHLKDLEILQKDLRKRRKGVFFLQQKSGELVATGNLYQELIQIQKEREQKAETPKSELHGSIANIGNVIGRVVICRSIAEISKVKKGDILVASMTRPELMPALKKVAAIVTDEGGITCHAAIVARELNIPAVIGARIATQVLKDGMLVEVKGNHGIVKILK